MRDYERKYVFVDKWTGEEITSNMCKSEHEEHEVRYFGKRHNEAKY